MVISSAETHLQARKSNALFRACSSFLALMFLVSACGTSDKGRLKEARFDFLREDFSKAEASLFTPEIFKNTQNRLEHYYFLSSIAMSEGLRLASISMKPGTARRSGAMKRKSSRPER